MKRFIGGFLLGILVMSLPAAYAMTSLFPDVGFGKWYEEAVLEMATAGVIKGNPDGTYRPNDAINRAEAAVMFKRFKDYVDARLEGKSAAQAAQEVAEKNNEIVLDSSTPEIVPQSESCAALPEPTGKTITVGSVQQLRNALNEANETGNVTILIEDGTYNMDNGLWISGANITFRGKSGDRDKVILKGEGMNGGITHIFWFSAPDITVADMTIGWVANHPIQIMGEKGAHRPHVHNVRIVDGKEQLLKVSFSASNTAHAEGGIVECSSFEFSAGIAAHGYTGGIDAHQAKDWIVRDNYFDGIRSPDFASSGSGTPAEHAIHFWSDSRNIRIERNIIVNSDRGIGLGLGDRGVQGGFIANNMIYHDATNADVGIGLENASDVQVYNNTIFIEDDYQNAIEYRFAGTNAEIANNITNKKIQQRNDGTAALFNNVTNAQKNWFKNAATGDLRLKFTVADVVDRGKTLTAVPSDIDSEARPRGSNFDIGADEF